MIGVFQASRAACGQSVTRHSLPEDAFKIPTCSFVIFFQVARYLPHVAGNFNTLRVKITAVLSILSQTLDIEKVRTFCMEIGNLIMCVLHLVKRNCCKEKTVVEIMPLIAES